MSEGGRAFCIEMWQLMEDYARAVSDYNRMNSAQVAAVLAGEDFQFQEEIAKAGARKDEAKYAILKHHEEHGCSQGSLSELQRGRRLKGI